MLPLLFLIWASAANATTDTAALISRARGARDVSPLDRWRDYALSSITPRFSWALRSRPTAPPSVIDNYGTRLDTPDRFVMTDASGIHFGVAAASAIVSDTPSVGQSPSLLNVPQSGLERTVLTPSIEHVWGDTGTVRLSAVLAYQRFATVGLGITGRPDDLRPFAAASGDSSFGTGARVDFSAALTNRLSWRAGYQSRVNMAPLSNYRGVFAEPGDFDIPANASFALRYALTPVFGVDIGVQRVMYSDITPFASSALPIRFLALLGDGASPTFAWRDLTVYSVGWSMHSAAAGDVELRYTTRQQPSPTSHLLARALALDSANSTISLGWTRATSQDSHLSFLASYASAPYFLGVPTSHLTNEPVGGRVEFQAIWAMRF
ncbi:MAG: hypothetical protein WB784_11200 [Rhodanobacteraceae bacterium]